MPDALSKTVPIWVAVLNRLLFSEKPASHTLRTPEDVISRSEHAQIEQRLPECVAELQDLALDVDVLRAQLHDKPMKVTWVTPDTFPTLSSDGSASNLIVLCTASGRTSADRPGTFDYVQGAADDSEAWALGLTPGLFWQHVEQLMSSSEDELPQTIESLLLTSRTNVLVRSPVLIKPTSQIWISNNAAAQKLHADFGFIISCSEMPDGILSEERKDRYIHLPSTTGKIGSRQLRSSLPKLVAVAKSLHPDTRMLVTCHTGQDLAVGAALALICLCYGDSGNFQSGLPVLSKTVIKQRLSWIMVSMPDAAPSRATLQSVNAFLLG